MRVDWGLSFLGKNQGPQSTPTVGARVDCEGGLGAVVFSAKTKAPNPPSLSTPDPGTRNDRPENTEIKGFPVPDCPGREPRDLWTCPIPRPQTHLYLPTWNPTVMQKSMNANDSKFVGLPEDFLFGTEKKANNKKKHDRKSGIRDRERG